MTVYETSRQLKICWKRIINYRPYESGSHYIPGNYDWQMEIQKQVWVIVTHILGEGKVDSYLFTQHWARSLLTFLLIVLSFACHVNNNLIQTHFTTFLLSLRQCGDIKCPKFLEELQRKAVTLHNLVHHGSYPLDVLLRIILICKFTPIEL